jgi:hypothetical protein
MEELSFDIKGGFFYKTKKLIINENFISLDNNVIPKKEIKGYRYGIRWIQLDLTFGREYVIYIQSDNKDLKISFKSYFGRNVNETHQLYARIVDGLWDYYFSDIIRSYLNKYDNQETFGLNSLSFSPEGITIKKPLQKQYFIPWAKVRTKSYQTYFAIHSADDPANINITSSYLEDWNTSVLFSVMRSILQAKQIETLQLGS